MRFVRLASGLLALSVAAACSDQPETPLGVPSVHAAGGTPSFTLYGARGPERDDACESAPHRQFDFWLGKWDVRNAEGALIGTNNVTEELEGCVVAEHWTSGEGVRGRSINAYDAETGQWHQTWVTQFTLGHIRSAGELIGGVMTLHGERPSPFGFTLFDDWTWTPLADGRVLQTGILEIPAFGFRSEFNGFYERSENFNPAPEMPGDECQVGGPSERTRELDFLRGEFRVESRPGRRRLGEAEVTADMSDCLIEERFEGRHDFEAVAFTYYDRIERVFYRTYIDSQGERLELSGDFENGALVLRGTDRLSGPGRPERDDDDDDDEGEDDDDAPATGTGRLVDVRVTFTPEAGGQVTQVVEVSSDAGMTWQEALRLTYIPD